MLSFFIFIYMGCFLALSELFDISLWRWTLHIETRMTIQCFRLQLSYFVQIHRLFCAWRFLMSAKIWKLFSHSVVLWFLINSDLVSVFYKLIFLPIQQKLKLFFFKIKMHFCGCDSYIPTVIESFTHFKLDRCRKYVSIWPFCGY